MMGRSLYQKKIGLIGYGKVARRFEQLLSPFTRSISYYDPFIEQPESSASRFTDLDELLAISDLISVHIPFSKRSEEHTSELQSRGHLVCRLLLEKKNK